MAESADEILEHLEYIRDKLDQTRDDVREVNARLGFLVSQCEGLGNRMMAVDGRLERVERRLD